MSVPKGWYINSAVPCVLRPVRVLDHLIVMADVLKDASVLMAKYYLMEDALIQFFVKVHIQ